jgi:ABC-type transport system involved in multi-copper enzyme maturation permease subunit
MLRIIIGKEILSHILTLRFTVTFMLFLVVIFASFYVTVNEHLLEVSRFGSRERVYAEKLSDILKEEQDFGTHGRIERLFWMEGRNSAVPAAGLGWMGQGLQAVLPAGINARAFGSQNIDRGLTRNPLLGLLATPDFIYVVNVVLSLLAILFMFDAVCGEKETGTLRLTLSNSVPRHSVLLGKWIGGYIVLLVPFLIATGGGLAYAWGRGALDPTAGNLIRIGLLIALACFYIAVFFNLSLFVSTTTHNSATALLVCLLLWVIFILAIPNLAPVTAKILEPTPALQKIEAEKRAVEEEIELKIDRLSVASGELHYGDKIERERERLTREGERRQRQWDRFYETACERQTELAKTLGRLSPSASWIYAATSLTDTGPAVHERLRESAKRYESAMGEFERAFFRAGRKPGTNEWPEITPDELPVLGLTFPNVHEAAKDALNDVLLLVIMNVVFFLLAFVFFLRYDVR